MQMARYRAMTGEQRVLEALELSDALLEVTAAGIRRRHPDYSEDEVRHALARQRFGDDLFRGAWPDAPLLDP
jgi:hypothetical protein